jgi:hypothetical protein
MVIGKCKLCGQDNIEILDSHIIPEFIYKPIYDEKHRYVDFTEDPRTGVRFVQKGVRENLLCHHCEELLSRYEIQLHDFIMDFLTNKNGNLIKLSSNIGFMKKIKYNDIKIALLSILYRMAVSKLSQFDGYSLGPYENVIKDIILKHSFTDRYTFSIHISPVTINGIYNPEFIMTYEKSSKYKDIYNLHCFIIYGLLIEVMLSKVPQNDDWHIFDLREKGKIILLDIDIKNVNIKHTLLNRFKDKDVKLFTMKLKKKC